MKPAWDQLMETFADSDNYLIADVDCTADGQSLCQAQGVRGYPTIKWGDPGALNTYKGGRDYDTLKQFADDNLKPICSPFNMDICDDEQKSKIKEYQAMASADLDATIAAAEKELKEAEEKYKAESKDLEDKFNALKTEKSGGISMMKSVKIASKKDKDEL